MTAVVYPQNDGYHVSIRLDDVEVDDAGPFDDLGDAVQMAKRTTADGGTVEVA